VLVMRHARSPAALPTPETASPGNSTRERQLDEEGRRTAAAMGAALRALRVPVGDVLTSPAFRTRETARYMELASARSVAELGDNAQSMAGVTAAQGEWLRARTNERPRAGNTLLITHQPNLARAFPDWGPSLVEGVAIFRPDTTGATLVGRIRIDEWPSLAAGRPAPR
jgi:phosphohistidine phosphatase SixA